MSAALGVAASVASGLANGSWNLPTKPDAPGWAYAGRVWAWENIWLVANLMIPCFNTAVVLLVIGPETLRAIYDAATPAQMWSIVVPSLGWGWGGVGFGQAIKRLGVALGTSIVMGIIVVIGTALPAIMRAEHLSPAQAAGAALGVALGIAGFVLGGAAGMSRDAHRAAAAGEPAAADAAAAADDDVVAVAVVEVTARDDPDPDPAASDRSDAFAKRAEETETSSPPLPSPAPSPTPAPANTFWGSMGWCVVGGVLSSMLQFAFVFGGALVEDAERRGVPETASAMPVWLLCFLFNAVGHCSYAASELRANGTWRLFFAASRAETFRATRLCALMAVAMPLHIHLYGVGAAMMGDSGAVFAWPLVMCATVFTAQSWSVVLREFEGAPEEAKRRNAASLAMLVASVAVVGVTGAGG